MGFDVEIKSQREGISRIYLLKGGERTGGFVNFYDNRLPTAKSLEKLVEGNFQGNSYLDLASEKLVALALVTAKASTEKKKNPLMKPQ